MKQTLTVLIITLVLTSILPFASRGEIVWSEDFNDQFEKGITGGNPPVTNMTGITKWTIETPYLSSNEHFVVVSNSTLGLYFESTSVDTECVWQSEAIDISADSYVEATVELREIGSMEPDDYIRTYYSVNGQPETLFAENGDMNDDFVYVQAKQEAIAGTNLVIVIRTVNSAGSESHRFDDIIINSVTPASNEPPSIAVNPSGTNKTVTVDSEITFDIIASEVYLDLADAINLKMDSGPAGATFAETNGTSPLTNAFTWTPDTAGDYTATFAASDKDGTNTLQVNISVEPSEVIVWIEDFEDPTLDGKGGFGTASETNVIDMVGVTNWSISITNAVLSASDDYFKVDGNEFAARDLDGECVWMSESIDISSRKSVSIEIDITGSGGFESGDYIRSYYSVDGGSETLLTENGDLTDDFVSPVVARSEGISGDSIMIVIRCHNGADAERHYFDNVSVLTPVGVDPGLLMIIK